jgi:iron complex outermembrane receptor protein
VFYYDVQDMMQSVTITPATLCGATATACTQMQNIGKVQTKGAELGILNSLTEAVEIGANFTLLSRKNVSNPSIILTDVPNRKLFAYVKWQAVTPLSVLASMEANSSRYSSSDGKRIAGGFGVANLKGMYQFNQAWSAEVGVNNLLDKNYMLVEGYPLEGRNYFANATMKF